MSESKPDHSPSHHKTTVQELVEDCLSRRAAGESVSDQSLIDSHPELMPELGRELKKLRIIGAARMDADTDRGSEVTVDFHAESSSATEILSGTVRTTSSDERFFKIEPHAAGGLGVVFLALDEQFKRKVALKELKEKHAVVGYSGATYISVLFNNQVGGFNRADSPGTWAPWYVAPGDFDADGDIDVVAVHQNESRVSLFEGFTPANLSPPVTLGNGAFPASVIATQLTDDNSDLVVNDSDRLDLAWVDTFPDVGGLPAANSVTALLNNGGGSFTPVTKDVGGRPFALAAGDLNGDGFNDLAVTIPENDQVAIFLNDQSGNFGLPSFIDNLSGPAAITAADLDNDLDIDLAVTNASDDGFVLLRNDGTGAFVAEISGIAAFPSTQAIGIVAAQLDNDPSTDLAIANGQGAESLLFFGNRLVDRALRVTVTDGNTVSGIDFGVLPHSADFDGDSDIDGFDFLSWQRGFGITAPNAVKSDGDADDEPIDLAFGLWDEEEAVLGRLSREI